MTKISKKIYKVIEKAYITVLNIILDDVSKKYNIDRAELEEEFKKDLTPEKLV